MNVTVSGQFYSKSCLAAILNLSLYAGCCVYNLMPVTMYIRRLGQGLRDGMPHDGADHSSDPFRWSF